MISRQVRVTRPAAASTGFSKVNATISSPQVNSQ